MSEQSENYSFISFQTKDTLTSDKESDKESQTPQPSMIKANKMIGPTDPTIIEYFIQSVSWKVKAEIVVIACNRGAAVELFTFNLIK